MSKLVLIRGIPGSGKTTKARTLEEVGFKHFEADQFFEQGGAYSFDAAKLGQAHQWCQWMTAKALQDGFDVVVSNTFCRRWEMEPYFQMAKKASAELVVIEATGRFENVHGVSKEKVMQMLDRWEEVVV